MNFISRLQPFQMQFIWTDRHNTYLEGRMDQHVLNRGSLTGQGTETRSLDLLLGPTLGQLVLGFSWYTKIPDFMWQECASCFQRMRALIQLTGQHVLWVWYLSSTSETPWINAFSGFQTHPGQYRSSPTPPLRSGRILILGQSETNLKHSS